MTSHIKSAYLSRYININIALVLYNGCYPLGIIGHPLGRIGRAIYCNMCAIAIAIAIGLIMEQIFVFIPYSFLTDIGLFGGPYGIYKAPTDSTKPPKQYTKPQNIRQRLRILDKTEKY